jgi:xanthine dehydrogenase accessory factor
MCLMIGAAMRQRAEELRASRTPFVVATVVNAAKPTSVRPGDSGLIFADGAIEGFVGGVCAEQSVRLQALRSLETDEPILLRILPGEDDAPAVGDAVTVHNPCLSGGAIEIFLEPVNPLPRVVVVGGTPIAAALMRLGAELGLDARHADIDGDELAVVVGAHGRVVVVALETALHAGFPYVGLVASPKRGAAVLAELNDKGVATTTLDTPAGLDIGARTPEEIALSILARIVTVRRRPEPVVEPAGAIDPICGMTVAATLSTPHYEHEGELYYFCCDGCRATFATDPSRAR